MASITIQMGHVPRTTGATGTRREQEFVKLVGPALWDALIAHGHTVRLIGADDTVPASDVFVSLHTDGNNNRNVRGASVGYPDHDGGRLAAAWKRAHQRNGFPGGFHRDNYTSNLSGYYGFRRSRAKYRFLAEHGTTTNPDDERWLFDNVAACVRAHIEAIGEVVGHPKNREVITPMYNPPLTLASGVGIVASLVHPQGLGSTLLLSDGGTWDFGPPYCGNVVGKSYFVGRKPARLEINPNWEAAGRPHPGTKELPWYIIKATSGEPYGHAGF